MAICSNCGTNNPDSAKFCGACGTALIAPAPATADTTAPASAPAKKGFPLVPVVVVGAIAAAAVVALVLFLSNRKATINLSQYATVVFDGFEGGGVADVDFDDTAFLAEYQSVAKGKKSSNALSELFSSLSGASVYDAFSYEVSPDTGLSNGDTVTLTWLIDDEQLQSQNKVRLVGEETIVTVEGLSEVREVDPFADVELVLEGVSPFVSAYAQNHSTDEVVGDIWFEVEEPETITPESTVRVYIDEFDVEYFEKYYGVHFTQTSKEYSCENVDFYAVKLSDLTESVVEDLKEYAAELLEEDLEEYTEEYTHGDLVYEGMVLADPTEDLYADTILTTVFSTKMTSLEAKKVADEAKKAAEEAAAAAEETAEAAEGEAGAGEAAEEAGEETAEEAATEESATQAPETESLVYLVVQFYNPIVHANGTMEFGTDYYEVLDSAGEKNNDYFRIGYQDKQELIEELTTENADQFSVDISQELAG